MRLITYHRVSTDEQVSDGVSLALSPQQLANYAATHGHTILRGIEDHAVSGSVPLLKRRGGAELCAALAAGEADGVLVIRLDRLFRDALDGLQFFATAARSDTPPMVLSTSELIDTSSPNGRLMLNMLLATAQYERDLAALRARENSRAMREQGRVYGTVPFGCVEMRFVGDGNESRRMLVRSPIPWAIRERILAMRASGESYDDIVHELWRLRISAPGGGRRWGKSTLRGIVETHSTLTHLPMQGEGGCP